MAIEITMPRLSDTMQQGTIVRWAVKEGQKVSSGDAIADIETDKATMELTTFDDGVVASLAVPEGKTVPVGTVIAVLASAGEDVSKAKAGTGAAAPGAKAAASGGGNAPAKASGGGTAVAEPPAAASPAPSGGNGHAPTSRSGERIFVSPLARKIANEGGIDLASIQGTGPSGRIVRKDVEAAMASGGTARGGTALQSGDGSTALENRATRNGGRTTALESGATRMLPPTGSTLAAKVVPLSNMRRTIATRLVQSKTTIPHYQVTVEADMDALMALREQLNDQLSSQGVKLTVNDFLVRACALAMHQHPFVNSRWAEKGNEASVEIIGQVNVGVAIALPEERGGGLVVATLRNADQIGLRQISQQTKALSSKAREKGLTIEEMSDATFTISNLGMFGVDHFTAIINPPNVAILAVGAAIKKPVVKNDQVVAGWVMSMTMSSDHRIVDGAMAAQYLNTVKGYLEKPATLLV
ncbi:MAG: 2-oxo acid dehydrogenase subunit E2 [Phycisphaeraceae bacterium]|nr:2-oxo acid dehydrogenase subunit E2 [Phycisphaeraceae bacterium]MBX3367357.1 2-oxo acid dehydrogenase subunit E2 [Phycisphaeraceae bacterium]